MVTPEDRGTGNEFPLSPGQQRMWSIQQLNSSTVAMAEPSDD
jgi:hypothetical protein